MSSYVIYLSILWDMSIKEIKLTRFFVIGMKKKRYQGTECPVIFLPSPHFGDLFYYSQASFCYGPFTFSDGPAGDLDGHASPENKDEVRVATVIH